jgi:hypothetical protein
VRLPLTGFFKRVETRMESMMELLAGRLGADAWISAAVSASDSDVSPAGVEARLPGPDTRAATSTTRESCPIDCEALVRDFCRELLEERKDRALIDHSGIHPTVFYVTAELRSSNPPVLYGFYRSDDEELCGMAFWRVPRSGPFTPFGQAELRELRRLLESFHSPPFGESSRPHPFN